MQLHAVGVTHVPIIPASPSVTQLLPSPLAVARDRCLSPCFKYVDSSDILTLFRRQMFVWLEKLTLLKLCAFSFLCGPELIYTHFMRVLL